MSNDLSLFLLAIRGTLASPTLEEARKLHNSTAGHPANVAAAKSLGDVSHMVYVPMEKPKKGAGEFLILDIWNSMDGINQFFANPTVQEQAGQIFTERDPVVWSCGRRIRQLSHPGSLRHERPLRHNRPRHGQVRG